MLTHTVQLRIFDTDMVGHCHHLASAQWFEEARNEIFEIFNPGMTKEEWNLLLVRIEIDYRAPIQFSEREVEIRTWISHLGRSSLHVAHGVYLKDGTCAAVGGAAMVYFDLKEQRTVPIPDTIREKLLPHLDPNCPYRMSEKK